MLNRFILAADIGGSHITSAMVDMEQQCILHNIIVRSRVNAHAGPNEIIDAWCVTMEKVSAGLEKPIHKIALAMPNPFDYEKGISYLKGLDKYDSLYELNVKDLLSARLRIDPTDIKMKNDAGCFLQGEVMNGAAFGYNHSIGVTLGTGIGSSRCHYDIAEDADLWHMSFLDGIAEDYLSTRWFIKRYYELTGFKVKDVKDLSELYDTDANVKVIFEEFAVNLSQFLARFVAMDDPEIIVMGGNIMKAAPFFLPQLEEHLKLKSIYVPIKKALLGENAAILGAAHCWANVTHKFDTNK